ncbi:DUF6266 family protein [Pedobacter sp. MC2016-24]|uniref:DUF6266 family protein n=1 Tax=Pedobacter sp. MC2016-24 TaxID=2780090 RepID=UPI0018824807|nr:DUF6266 family protein [Pedobacter sp. MC2016-24]MBE9600738.1 hypothetical protein [Pedobacter sp. MC2016-24]
MGIIKQGVLGGFANKTGAVVGAYHRGQDTIRALPRKTNKAPTQVQKDQRFKFALVTGIISRIDSLVDVGYALPGSKITTAVNEAVKYHLTNAVAGVSPNFTFDYTKLRFSTGNLEMAQSVLVDSIAASKVKFSWDHVEQDSKKIDGTDTSKNGSREGTGVFRRTRHKRTIRCYTDWYLEHAPGTFLQSQIVDLLCVADK